jgi:serine protein kinase
MPSQISQDLKKLSEQQQESFHKDKNALSFDEFLDLVSVSPLQYMRNSAVYLRDMINWHGIEKEETSTNKFVTKYNVFKEKTNKNKTKIVGQEFAQERIVKIIDQFVRQGKIDKLILLHGPNGSSKSSTAEALALGLEKYSQSSEGILYKFSWIFPTDKVGNDGLGMSEQGKKIGFGSTEKSKFNGSFAHLNDSEILCKMNSELKENPILILPKKIRLNILNNLIKTNQSIPTHIEHGELSSKNKKIFDALFSAYQGDLNKVLQHVQVERFYISSRYKIGAVTVEPQMNIDAQEKQLTMDRNISNIPTVLQNIRFYEPVGDLVEANRGIIEFADLLKRPLETFKYLLTTIEKMSVNLNSGQTDLDLIMIASSNEKHLDAFKATPDWASFKGRFELVKVPYLLSYKEEEKIYEEDVQILSKIKPIARHALNILSKWAVLTRFRSPETEKYEEEAKSTINKVTPFVKLNLFSGNEDFSNFSDNEAHILKKYKTNILEESQNSVAYEGRFGASPREMKMLLYFASQQPKRDMLSALSVFDEIEALINDRSVYDYLQFEPRSGYHDVSGFLEQLRQQYSNEFHQEFLNSLGFFDSAQYENAFAKYLKHVVAYIKGEKVENDITGKFEPPSDSLMTELEKLLTTPEEFSTFRQKLVNKVASWRVDNPSLSFNIGEIFKKEILDIGKKIYENKKEEIIRVKSCMLMWGSPDYNNLSSELLKSCQACFNAMKSEYGYSEHTVWESLVFIRKFTGSI